MRGNRFHPFGTLAVVAVVCIGQARGEPRDAAGAARRDGSLPRVLLIGDSISLGYTPEVQRLLRGRADVTHAPGNNGHSANGLKLAATWVGKGGWDVIHFNHGIWDVHLLENGAIVWPVRGRDFSTLRRRHTQEEYLTNLRGILEVLEPAATTVIFATTTPWTTYGEETTRRIAENNEAACGLMRREGVHIDDLHALALPQLQAWHAPDGVHFNATGNRHLGAAVARSIADALGIALAEPVATAAPAGEPPAAGPAPPGRSAEAFFERGGDGGPPPAPAARAPERKATVPTGR